ncbi:MAG: hypothetical protein B6D56_08180 [Candidatus Omnitrophica bacterium 4484_70.1]|nr:MAG: hypothetical protein B6D56_08180 [Candidatus Omnitrophica bacterium 4484_70.1]
MNRKAEVEIGKLEENLYRHVYKLAGKIGDRNIFNNDKLEEGAEYIKEQFLSFGYNVKFQDYNVGNKQVKNIIVNKRGERQPQEVIVVGAHYDTCFNPGGDNNGSGIAGLLELARFLSCKQVERSIKFVAFVNEEPPFFKTESMGSRVFVRQAKANKESIKGAIILEMIGYYTDQPYSQHYPPFYSMFYPDRGNFIAVVGNFHSRGLVKKIVSIFRSYTDFPIKAVAGFSFLGIDFSDHWSFWKEKYQAVMVTDTGFYRNPHYHRGTDTYDTLDYRRMAEVVKGLGRVLMKLAREDVVW